MGRQSTRKRSRRNPRQGDQTLSEKPRSVLWRWAAKVGAVLFTLLGAAAALDQFSPRLSLATDAPFDPSDPFSIPFILTNESSFSIHDVGMWCKINSLVLTSPRSPGGKLEIARGTSGATQSVADTISSEDRKESFCFFTLDPVRQLAGIPEDVPFELQEGDISISISYRPYLLWPKKSERAFHFVALRASDGSLRWIPSP
jgi:hypothetical protein